MVVAITDVVHVGRSLTTLFAIVCGPRAPVVVAGEDAGPDLTRPVRWQDPGAAGPVAGHQAADPELAGPSGSHTPVAAVLRT